MQEIGNTPAEEGKCSKPLFLLDLRCKCKNDCLQEFHFGECNLGNLQSITQLSRCLVDCGSSIADHSGSRCGAVFLTDNCPFANLTNNIGHFGKNDRCNTWYPMKWLLARKHHQYAVLLAFAKASVDWQRNSFFYWNNYVAKRIPMSMVPRTSLWAAQRSSSIQLKQLDGIVSSFLNQIISIHLHCTGQLLSD